MNRTARLAELFQAATSPDEIERQGALNAAAGEDLHRELDTLLAADTRNRDGFLSRPLIDHLADVSPGPGAALLEPGSLLGRCRVRTLLFRNERSAVYLAEQNETQRAVAVKVLQHGAGSAGEILVRFEQERRIVAMMRHENIAALYDAGAADDGSAYFIMEYVEGRPITEFCEAEGLPTTDRLRLFLQLCKAVEHAHHRGVIHRDLKPANILVTRSEHGPVVKVIDFGIAKLESDAGRATQHGQILGTIGYMAPEQIERGGATADTRSDCYSLGAVLYEVLTGRPAIPTEGAGPLTVLSRIASEQPERMSRIRPRLRGDLERIVSMALHKDIQERYQTVEALRGDLQRFLQGRPVFARGSQPLYVATRLVLRHRRIAAVAALLGIAAAAAGVRWWNAERAKFDLALEISGSWFDQCAMMAKTVIEHSQRGPYLATLDSQSQLLFERAPAHAGVVSLRADVLGALGDMELESGRIDKAEERFAAVLDLRERLAARFPGSIDRAADWSIAIVRIGDAAYHRKDYAGAKERFERAMTIDRALVGAHPVSARARTLLGWSCDRLASMAGLRGDDTMAEGLYQDALEHFQVLITLEESADARRGLAMAYLHTGALAGRRGDAQTWRRNTRLAVDEATRAADLAPRDRLAVWAMVGSRQAHQQAMECVRAPDDQLQFALDTLRLTRKLVDRDPSDQLGRDHYLSALAQAALCAERCGKRSDAERLRAMEAEERGIVSRTPSAALITRVKKGS